MEIVKNKIWKVMPKDIKNGTIDIPYGIEAIASDAFLMNYNLEKIEISNSVLSIGTGAFQECKNLKTVVFHQRTQQIYLHPGVFKNSGIEMIEFPNEFLYRLSTDLLKNCCGLTELHIPSSVNKLNLYSFNGCIFLDKIHWKGKIYSYNDLFVYKTIY